MSAPENITQAKYGGLMIRSHPKKNLQQSGTEDNIFLSHAYYLLTTLLFCFWKTL